MGHNPIGSTKMIRYVQQKVHQLNVSLFYKSFHVEGRTRRPKKRKSSKSKVSMYTFTKASNPPSSYNGSQHQNVRNEWIPSQTKRNKTQRNETNKTKHKKNQQRVTEYNLGKDHQWHELRWWRTVNLIHLTRQLNHGRKKKKGGKKRHSCQREVGSSSCHHARYGRKRPSSLPSEMNESNRTPSSSVALRPQKPQVC